MVKLISNELYVQLENSINNHVEHKVAIAEREILRDVITRQLSGDSPSTELLKKIESLEDQILNIYHQHGVNTKTVKRTLKRFYDIKLNMVKND